MYSVRIGFVVLSAACRMAGGGIMFLTCVSVCLCLCMRTCVHA